MQTYRVIVYQGRVDYTRTLEARNPADAWNRALHDLEHQRLVREDEIDSARVDTTITTA